VIETIRSLAKELVDLRPDAIFCMPTLAASGLAPETRTIPIVFAVVGDPIGSGLVTSYARPGRNITGFASFDPAISGKWVQLLEGDRSAHRAGSAVIQPGNGYGFPVPHAWL
jgi:putative tryptophan/tyrosine transport system substrate-binding protein